MIIPFVYTFAPGHRRGRKKGAAAKYHDAFVTSLDSSIITTLFIHTRRYRRLLTFWFSLRYPLFFVPYNNRLNYSEANNGQALCKAPYVNAAAAPWPQFKIFSCNFPYYKLTFGSHVSLSGQRMTSLLLLYHNYFKIKDVGNWRSLLYRSLSVVLC